MGAVQNAMRRDDKDPSIMDLDPSKSLKSQMGGADVVEDGPPLKDDPEYSKYFKMLKMGTPMGAVQNAMRRDDKDPSIMDLDPGKSLKSQTDGGDEVDDGPPLKDDPEYSKYFKMLKMGTPIGAVQNALRRDDKDPSIMDLNPEKSLKSQTGGGDEVDDGPPLKDDPEYSKYFKMLKMGTPIGAVQNALRRDEKDPSIMDLNPEKSLKSQTGGKSNGQAEKVDEGPSLQDDPEYGKYFKMVKMGLPIGAIKNAIERDGKDASIMDLDPSKSIASQRKSSNGRRERRSSVAKKPRVRRKKIYWNPIEPGQVKENSLWGLVRDRVQMKNLTYDVKEFEDLFTESADPAAKKTVTKSVSKAKKSVQVIDGKRSMNGGIVLLRLKIDYGKIARMVNKM
jgi:hypothetical protein